MIDFCYSGNGNACVNKNSVVYPVAARLSPCEGKHFKIFNKQNINSCPIFFPYIYKVVLNSENSQHTKDA